MYVSLNELWTRYAKAIEALGLPAGLASEAAEMVAWHDIWDLGGLAALDERLERLDGLRRSVPRVRPRNDRVEVDGLGASLLALGPQVLDVLEEELGRSGRARVDALNVTDGDLAAGLLALARDRALSIRVQAIFHHTMLRAWSSGGRIAIGWCPTDDATTPAPGLTVCAIDSETWSAEPSAMDGCRILSPETLALREKAALENGVAVDPRAWRRVVAVGHRFLVTESEESRSRGAGGGDDND